MAYRENGPQRRRDEVHYDLKEKIGVLSTKDNGWSREVNIVSWNGGTAKVDIREWDPEHVRMSKGVTLFEEEAEKLAAVLAKRYGIVLGESGHMQRDHAASEGAAAECAAEEAADYNAAASVTESSAHMDEDSEPDAQQMAVM